MTGDHGAGDKDMPAKKAKATTGKVTSVPRQRHSSDDVKMAQILHRHTLLMAVVDRCGKIGMILAFAVPLWFMQPMVNDLAGKTTNINAVMTASLAINAALAGGNIIQYSRRRSQGQEIRRQRDRSDMLESQVRQPIDEKIAEGER